MTPLRYFQCREWISRLISFAVILTIFTTGILLIEPVAWAGGTVTSPTEASLRAAMTGGGTVTFACDGVITLGNTISNTLDTILDGSGHQVTISGNNTVRVFYVNTNVTFTAINLAIANGRSVNGAGIFNDGGTLNLSSCTFQSNAVNFGSGNQGIIPLEGGALYNRAGIVNATNCVFKANVAQSPGYVFRSVKPPPAQGGAVRNQSGVVNFEHCTFTDNSALAAASTSPYSDPIPGSDASGGAIHNSGILNASQCAFVQNSSTGGSGQNGLYGNLPLGQDGGTGSGGAVYSLGNSVITGCFFFGNNAAGGIGSIGGYYQSNLAGGTGGAGGSGSGGALFNGGGASLNNCTFASNSAAGARGGSGGNGGPSIAPDYTLYGPGGEGGKGGDADGAALCNAGTLDLVNCTISQNTGSSAAGGPGGGGGSGGSGGGGRGGDANGAVLNSGRLTLVNCTLARNTVLGASGGVGGGGNGGGGPGGGHPMYERANGGLGGSGGDANGAAFNGGTLSLVNCTVTQNTGTGGSGGSGGSGSNEHWTTTRGGGNGGDGGNGASGFGGITDTNGGVAMTNCTLALNSSQGGLAGPGGSGGSSPAGSPGSPGSSGFSGVAGGGLDTVGTPLLNTILSANTPMNCSGTIIDAGYNLSSDSSCAFTGVGSMNNTDPKLGPLTDNGGPTLTMALLPGSPAIDAGDNTAAPPTDQRGVTRPQGAGVDIGAFEYQSVPMFSSAEFQTPTSFRLQMSGLLPDQTYTLQTSSNLLNWSDLTNVAAGSNGMSEFVDCNQGNYKARFYRLKSSNP